MKTNNIINFAAIFIVVTALFAFTKGNERTPPQAYEFTSFTIIESIVPNGIGRSRIINSLEQRDYTEFTTIKSFDDRSRNKSKRSYIRVFNYEETKLLNFYNIGGIRFQNIAANDAIINNKVNTMLNNGWEIVNIVSGVESVGGEDDMNGIFLTRFYLKRAK